MGAGGGNEALNAVKRWVRWGQAAAGKSAEKAETFTLGSSSGSECVFVYIGTSTELKYRRARRSGRALLSPALPRPSPDIPSHSPAPLCCRRYGNARDGSVMPSDLALVEQMRQAGGRNLSTSGPKQFL